MIDEVRFISEYARVFNLSTTKAFLDRPLIGSLVGLLHLLKMFTDDLRMENINYRSYCLATVRAECGPTYEPVVEKGPYRYFAKYEPGTKLGISLGNLFPGDGFRFRGRGYVQLTGRGNYSKFSTIMDQDLLNNPDEALNPAVAYEIMVRGMIGGEFTGKRLADYMSASHSDFVGARHIINGQDRAKEIATDAVRFSEILLASEKPDVVT